MYQSFHSINFFAFSDKNKWSSTYLKCKMWCLLSFLNLSFTFRSISNRPKIRNYHSIHD